MIEGGIRMPSVPPAAMHAGRKRGAGSRACASRAARCWSWWPRWRPRSRTPSRSPRSRRWSSRPGRRASGRTRACARRYTSAAMPATAAKLPISRNSGIAARSRLPSAVAVSVPNRLTAGLEACEHAEGHEARDAHRRADRHVQRDQREHAGEADQADRDRIAHLAAIPVSVPSMARGTTVSARKRMRLRTGCRATRWRWRPTTRA